MKDGKDGVRRWEFNLILGRLREVYQLCYKSVSVDRKPVSVNRVLQDLSRVIEDQERWKRAVRKDQKY